MPDIKRILLAEDNPNDIELTLAALAEIKLVNEVITTRDGEETLDYLYRRGQFSHLNHDLPIVLLLDLKMPKVSGLEVLRQIKQDPNLRRLPVVILTSSREERDLIEGYQLGVNSYVVKPIDFSQFLESIKQIGCFWAIINEPPPTRINAHTP
jgi:CheY-like chemotaxis protein